MLGNTLTRSDAASGTVFILNGDPVERRELTERVAAAGLTARVFDTGAAFVAEYKPTAPSCLLLAVRLPDMSGFDVLARLAAVDAAPSTIMITGAADVPTAIRAMKAGAVDLLVPPFAAADLLTHIRQALEQDAREWRARHEQQTVAGSLARLTPRERQVMDLVLTGGTNREIGFRLGIREKTVEVHRANMMRKIGAGNVAELVRLTARVARAVWRCAL